MLRVGPHASIEAIGDAKGLLGNLARRISQLAEVLLPGRELVRGGLETGELVRAVARNRGGAGPPDAIEGNRSQFAAPEADPAREALHRTHMRSSQWRPRSNPQGLTPLLQYRKLLLFQLAEPGQRCAVP